MYGIRARIGLIILSVNTAMEPELCALKPEEVSVHAPRLHYLSGISIKEQSRTETMFRNWKNNCRSMY